MGQGIDYRVFRITRWLVKLFYPVPTLEGLEHLSLNTVGYHPHHSHFSLDEVLVLADRIGAKHTWLTHLSHAFPSHDAFCDELRRLCAERGIRSDVQPAYDGLVVSAG